MNYEELIDQFNRWSGAEKKPCKWKIDKTYEYQDTWDTECGQCQYFTEGNIKENHYKFCPYCGKEIDEVAG